MVICGIPAYNEGKYIEGIITKVKKYVDEVIVVNDGSSDDTAMKAENIGVTVINHEKNLGYGAAIIKILAEAKERMPDVLVIIDADTQHDPHDIPSFILPICDGYDLVIGSRNGSDVPRYRYLGGRVLSVFTRVLSGANVIDSQSGFRAYSPRAIQELNPKEKGMAISSEIILEAAKNKLKIKEVPISIRYTNDSSTHNPIYQGFYTLYRIMILVVKRWMT